MNEILDYTRLEILINEVFWQTIPRCRDIPFKGKLIENLGLDSLDILDLASEFHFRFDMLSGEKQAFLLQYKTAEDWFEQIYLAANNPNKRFGFFSSGSTGKPKEVWHHKEMLLQERDFWLDFTNAKGVLCLVPVRHIYGFIWGLLLGTKLKRVQFLKMSEWHEIAKRANEDDLIIGHPAVWQQITPPFPHRFAISSTAPMDKELTEKFRSKKVNGLSVYGSTETAAIAWQAWENSYFELLPYWKKNNDKLLRNNQDYFIPDRLEWLNHFHFKLIGRKDQVIQIGGENVSLTQVYDYLKKIPGVKNVWVKPLNRPWGTRIYSYFQLHTEEEKDHFEKNISNYLKTLPTSFRPREWDISYKPLNKLDI